LSEPFHIRRIRLINFHNLVDEMLHVRKNLFLIGDNQSGKTTILDAVHFTLSAGVEMEFNAAARFGPRTEHGRNLASIVLRYDLERDICLRAPSVMYAALEIANDSGTTHTFGAGAFATSLETNPDVWGFVARGRTLEEVDLCIEEPDVTGALRRRPRDRLELEHQLGRGAVLDKGRYRTAVAQMLFRDRDAYERALELVAAGKAYREMVARARNLDDLFTGLLPPPVEAEFEEVRSALRAIEGIRSDLADLDAELAVLRGVIDKLQETRRETEKIARYQYVGAELQRREAADALRKARTLAKEAAHAATEAERRKSEAAADVASREATLRAQRATEGAALLERELEARQDVAAAQDELARAKGDLEGRKRELERAAGDAANADDALDSAKTRAGNALFSSIADGAREHLDQEALVAVSQLADAIVALEPDADLRSEALEAPWTKLRGSFEAARDRAARRAALAEGEAKRLRIEADAAASEADEVRRRAEILPELPGYGTLLAGLTAVADRAVPLYRLFALAPGIAESMGAAIECLLGPRVLGAIVVPQEQHAAARAHVLAHGNGIEVIDPAEGVSEGAAPAVRTLPAVLMDADALARIARTFLERVAGDVSILEAGEARDGARRAIWADGHLYEEGAESRIELAAPRFLGAEARARAAAAEEARLRQRAEVLRAAAKRYDEEAETFSIAAEAQGRVLEGLKEVCTPSPLIALVEAARAARSRVSERHVAFEMARDRVGRQEEAVSKLAARHQEILTAVASAGAANLHDRITRSEQELTEAQKAEKEAIDQASAARTNMDARAREEKAADDSVDAKEKAAQAKRTALEPLVEPKHRADLDDYVFRVMRGSQIRPENVTDLVSEADRTRARAFQWLDSSDGIRNQRLWQKYAFRLIETEREIRDQAGRPVEEVYEQRDTEVQNLQQALDEGTRDLLERVVMAGLARRLQGQVSELHGTIQGINRLVADLRFGTSRYQFSLRKRTEFQRLLDLLREQSILQPTLRDELRDFFQARLDDLRQTRQGEVPEILDYRRWFEYVLQVQSRADGTAQDLPRQRLRFGSTGEQAVPTYLLVIAVASLLYDRTEARLRVLLLDEAFLGIDAGRREVLMQFADRAGVDLIVATPELDGVTPALEASSTLFIEKNAELDVFIRDFHWERPPVQPGLFDRPAEPSDGELVLGAAHANEPSLTVARGDAPVADPDAIRREPA
jgi:hypothetical protein